MDDNSIYRDLFFEETDEYLQALNEGILQLEKTPEDKSVLDEIFRAAHTLKGMAATMGYSTMSELTHSMESVLEQFRNGKNVINSDIISLIFKCLDKLSEIVEALREEDDEEIDIKQLLDNLSNVAKDIHSIEKNEEIEIKPASKAVEMIREEHISDTDRLVIQNAKANGYNAYSISIQLEEECILKGARAYLVINRLEQEGEIIHSDPPAQEVEEGNFNLGFKLIYLSKSEKESIEETISNIAEIEWVEVNEIILDSTIAPSIKHKEPAPITEAVKEQPPVEKAEEEKKSEQKQEAKSDNKNGNHQANQSIRVDIAKLDSFMNLVSELVIYRTRLEDLTGSGDMSDIHEPLEHVARITSELQDLVLKIRMEPVNIVFNRFPRMIRDLSRELNKDIDLIIEGEDTELDRTVVSELGEPLIHLIRNAADHGIEGAEERAALNKPSKGTIKLIAYQEGNRVVIIISDDGKGIDPQVIKESAERKGISTGGMSNKDLVQLIFAQGFSTAKNVTNVSGRGVGMDVVRQKISSLGGNIEVESEVGKGTSFIIRLPLTLSIIQALMVNIGTEIFAIPLGIIETVVRIKEDEIYKSHNTEVYLYRDTAVPVVRLNNRLNLESDSDNNHLILTLLGDQYYGLMVDDLIGQQEIVIKKLTGILGEMKEYLGANILGNGDIALILDVGNLCSERTVDNVE